MSFWPHVLIAALLLSTAQARAQAELVIPPGGGQASASSERPATSSGTRSARKPGKRAKESQASARPPVMPAPPQAADKVTERATASEDSSRTPASEINDRATASEIRTRVATGGPNDPAMARYYAEGWRPASEFPNVIDHLPFTIYASQSVTYNDNLLLLPDNAVIPPGRSRGDLYSLTTVGLSSRIPVAAQHLFVDGTYGITRYRDNSSLDSSNYLVNGGIDWVFTSRCSGRLVATARQVQAPIEELTSFSNNDVQTVAGKESAKCRVGDNVNVIADSGLSRTTNSLGSLITNDYDQYYIRGGLEYALADMHTLGGKVTYTNSDYFNRSVLTTPGLATGLEQTEYAVYYKRMLSPKLEFDGSLGFTESKTTSPLTSSSFTKPTYSVLLRWQATPKFIVTLATAATVAPPQNIVADYERIRTDSVSATYLYSPKLSFTASLGQSHLSNPTSSGFVASPILVDQRVYFTELRTNYAFTPLTNATFQYRYTNRKDETLGVTSTSNLFMLGLNYKR